MNQRLSFSLPRGITEVTPGVGRVFSLVDGAFGGLVSFLGFLTIFSRRCSWAMGVLSVKVAEGRKKQGKGRDDNCHSDSLWVRRALRDRPH